MVSSRTILKFFTAVAQDEGVGARVRRSIGTIKMRNFTPFLMLDHFNVKPPAGFPDHPHHGQETITYVLSGAGMAHEDFTGSVGILMPGDLQFMTAGKGIVHSEIPVRNKNNDACVGMQLWVDLPKDLKDCEPRYRDLKSAEIPVITPNDKLTIKVISGESYGTKSVKDLAYTPVDYYHYTIKKGGSFEQKFPVNFNVFLYLLKGSLKIGSKVFNQYDTIFFNRDGDSVQGSVAEDATEDCEFVLIGGQTLDQEIVQYGPFVETSKEKMHQVFLNYQSGKNGFERAAGWSSKIRGGVKEEDVVAAANKKQHEEL